MDLSDLRLVEIAYGAADPVMRARAEAFLARIGAEAIACPTDAGFAGAFLIDRALALADRLMVLGITPWELDEALEAVGFATGLLLGQDRMGLDVAYARRLRAGAPLPIADRMVREGRLGRAVGVGWYRYPGGGGAVIDPLLEDMIVEEARFGGVTRLEFSAGCAARTMVRGVAAAAQRLHLQGLEVSQTDRLAARKLELPDLSRMQSQPRAPDPLASVDPVLDRLLDHAVAN